VEVVAAEVGAVGIKVAIVIVVAVEEAAGAIIGIDGEVPMVVVVVVEAIEEIGRIEGVGDIINAVCGFTICNQKAHQHISFQMIETI
jgi:hypothetical protein